MAGLLGIGGGIIKVPLMVFAGAQTGSRISIKVDKILLKKIYAIFLFLISAWMMVNVVK